MSARMCWDGDTKDVNFRICPSPHSQNLFVATAGSGHGFKFMPVIGKYVADMLESKISPEYLMIYGNGALVPHLQSRLRSLIHGLSKTWESSMAGEEEINISSNHLSYEGVFIRESGACCDGVRCSSLPRSFKQPFKFSSH